MPKTYRGRVILIHGARVGRKSRNKLCRLAPAFRTCGFCTIIPTYGFLPALLLGLIPWLDDRIAETISGFIEPNDVLVGHSNGGTLVYLVSKRLPIKGAVLINPALDSRLCPNASFVHVYYNGDDIITQISSLFPCSPWGSMGGEGYLGKDQRVKNIDQGHPPDGLPKLSGHSDIFRVGKCRKWARFMAELVLQDVLALIHRKE